jgi:glutaminyl-peptide cyclotransferase
MEPTLSPSQRACKVPSLRGVPALLASMCVIAAMTAGCGAAAATPSDPPRATAHHFDANAAWKLIELQVGYGQRPAGSPQLRRMADRLRRQLPHGHFEAVPGQKGVRNVVGTLPGRRPGIVLGAHYDTLVEPKGFVGANNGAAGSAIVIQAARSLARMKRPRNAREVRFVLFDGEEPAAGLPEDTGDFYDAGLRGSRAYVKANPHRTAAMLLLDYVGNKGLRLPREANSTTSLWKTVRSSAESVGVKPAFPNRTGPSITDDHSPFLRAGVPAVDFIDWSYPGHDISDRLDKLSRRSVDAVGETVTTTVQRLRR